MTLTIEHPAFTSAVADLVARLPSARLHTLADQIEQGWLPDAVVSTAAGDAPLIAAVMDACQRHSVPSDAAAAYLRGATDGFAAAAQRQRVDLIFSGPASTSVPVRATADAVTDLADRARHELILVTHSARPHVPLADALRSALSRGVCVDVVVETLSGLDDALFGPNPATAFTQVPGIRLWHWPAGRRTAPGARTHARFAVADRSVLLITSADLTQGQATGHLEAGVVIRGGGAPDRAATHIRHLQADNTLVPLSAPV